MIALLWRITGTGTRSASQYHFSEKNLWCRTSFSFTTMKCQPSVMAALVMVSSALVPPPVSNYRHLPLAKSNGQNSHQRHLTGKSKPDLFQGCNRSLYISTSLKSAVSDDILEVRDTSMQQSEIPMRRSIAKGRIISAFRGGLFAVRLEDDITDTEKGIDKPQIVDTTKALPKIKASSSSNTLGGDLIGRQVLFENGQTGVVVIHRPPIAFAYADTDSGTVHIDDRSSTIEGSVTIFDNLLSIQIQDNVRQCNCFGRNNNLGSDDYDNNINNKKLEILNRPIFAPIPQVKDIALINKPLVTGVTMFDALAPIGKGQNMLLIGHDIDDMRRYVTDILSIQTRQTPATKCIYASTGRAEDHETIKSLIKSVGLDNDIVMVANNEITSTSNKNERDDASRAAEATVVAATACAIGEAFALERGMDSLVIIDSLDQHKKMWDTTTRVLVDVFGVDSVVKGDLDGGASSEMRAFFSSLVQRSAQYKSNRGGGSVTLLLLQTIPKVAVENEEEVVFSPEDFERSPDNIKERINLLVQKKIPLTAATLRKIQIPCPSTEDGLRRLALQHVDELISMSDGQIWLDERLEQSGRFPPMDFQRSLTRIGIGADTESRADAAAMRRVVEGLRLDLSQAASMDGVDVETRASKKQKRNEQAWLLAMHQPSASGARKLSESCVAMLAASTGALNDSIDRGILPGSSEGISLIRDMLDHVSSKAPEAMVEIDSTLDFSAETKTVIEKAIQSYFDN